MIELQIVKPLAIARKQRRVPASAVLAVLLMLGGGVFISLASSRAQIAQRDAELPALSAASISTPVALPAATPVASVLPVPLVPVPAASGISAPTQRPAIVALAPTASRENERARVPTLIVDLAQASPSRTTLASSQAVGGAPLPPAPIAPPDSSVSDTNRFSARVSAEQVETAEATQLPHLNRLIPQGAIIAAVMETAVNSDLPGFARATVQRDVLGFDGADVLIPAGSRVIGQYESGLAQGASRIFIVWTRLIRPDGVTIALASPAIDELGRGGVPGKVNRHFLQRFGGSILLSVLTGGISAASAAASRGSSVIVSSTSEASGLAAQASRDLDIPPTIKTPQGAAVRIFVARDLDFTRVGPVR